MAACMICGNEIGQDQDTLEHLIPASIGGRRGVHGFIHRICNSKAGDTWDAALAVQLHPLSLMFAIKRQRGETPNLSITTTAAERFDLGPGAQMRLSDPVFKKINLGNGKFSIQIGARDLKEARRMLQNLRRKYPEIDVDAMIAAAQIKRSYAQGDIRHSLSIGGPQSGRSIVKSLLAMAFVSGVDWAHCDHALHYIREEAAEPSYGFYTDRDLVVGRVSGMPLHCLAVRADPTNGLILAYAEYYGTFRIVSCLGEGYTGDLVETCYAIDPRNGSELKARVDLSFDQADIRDIYAYRRVNSQAMQQAMSAVIEPALKAQHDREQRRVVSAAVKKACETCGAKPGDLFTKEHLLNISRTVAEEVTPYILHRRRPVRPPRGKI